MTYKTKGYSGIKTTWEQLTEIEPRLKDLLHEVKAIRDPGGAYFCANEVWYGNNHNYPNFREKLYRLVGWEARIKDPMLNSPEAFDLAYRRIYQSLPDCRGCLCL